MQPVAENWPSSPHPPPPLPLCVCVCVFHNEKKVPDEWQARQTIPATLQVSSSKHNAALWTTYHHVCVCVCHNEKKVPDEWQARQVTPAILCVCVCVCALSTLGLTKLPIVPSWERQTWQGVSKIMATCNNDAFSVPCSVFYIEPNLAIETNWELGPLIPTSFDGCNSQVWLYTVQWIPFLMFFFIVCKNKIARSSNAFQIFRITLLWPHLFPTVWMRSLAQKKLVFWATGFLCHAFSGGLSGKMRIKSICKGKQHPVEYCC